MEEMKAAKQGEGPKDGMGDLDSVEAAGRRRGGKIFTSALTSTDSGQLVLLQQTIALCSCC